MSDPKSAQRFRFVRVGYEAATGTVELVYAFDSGPELIERVLFPSPPDLLPQRRAAFDVALRLLHLIAGVSYYKAGVPAQIAIDGVALDIQTAELLDAIYLHGLGEFAYQNQLDLQQRIHFPRDPQAPIVTAPALGLPRRTLVPIGGGKDSLVSVELLRAAAEPATAVYVGRSALIAACIDATALPMLNMGRELPPLLFELNRRGAYNGHIPVTAINSAILVVAAVLYGFDAIAFSNERSASSATLASNGREINHQWSKSLAFERLFGDYVQQRVARDLDYFSLLRPFSELAVTRRFAPLIQYHGVFSSCNRNFKILGARPETRWCGQCPKCHFVFLALAPFMPKAQLVRIFGRNLLDDTALAGDFDALLEWGAHKPFECVGEAQESRAALFALAARADWREDALIARFVREILPHLDHRELQMEALLSAGAEHRIPARLQGMLHAPG